ncbi:neurochondrin [Megalops cyprinoides]|uniref:neurochondrin n=1 Tax=Megalops cyprinoides TaxID=118141 RepID=UPI001864DCF2|nr:neurochondrin [Megalops cyprinoides]XP_036371669.1 neurochondrin [Megalops cyprinoides]XP_036371670.1 neurochondrin [Megalops cyprinoides]
MTETGKAVGSPVNDDSSEQGVGGGKECPGQANSTLTPAQRDMLERCLHALIHAKNDSHTLAALLLITRVCPANQLDSATLRRVFEAVGLGLPARLLVTAVRGGAGSELPPEELLSLGAALLAALSTDPGMAAHPQLLSTIPLLLGLLADGPTWTPQSQGQGQAETSPEQEKGQTSQVSHTNGAGSDRHEAAPQVDANGSKLDQDAARPGEPGEHQGPEESLGSEEKGKSGVTKPQGPATQLDEALAADCYQVLSTVCASARGPEQLLSRGAIPALCRAVSRNQTLSRERGLPLLGHLLSSRIRPTAWSKHPADLLSLLAGISSEFCQASHLDRLEICIRLPQFLPLPGGVPESEDLRGIVSQLWEALRPILQAKVTPAQLGPLFVMSACLLDLFGWELVGSPKFCCLLVNRACVEVRMGLEELPGTDLSPEQQQVLTACYRIMEAAMEQACSQGLIRDAAQPQTAITGLSLQQSRQVLGILEEAFSAVIYYLQQVDQSHYGDPFLFATFRSLCAWLAEETSCLKEEVTALLPFLVNYAKGHLEGGSGDKGLASWMSEMSVSDSSQGGAWTGQEALRYLLPALCHLSAEEAPRRVLLTLDTPALLVQFLGSGWGALKHRGGAPRTRDPSLETACSALLNFTVTEPDRVRKDPCFSSLQSVLSDALPVLLHKPRLLVLAANFCTLGLMIDRLKPAGSGPVEPAQRRFFAAALRFLAGALSATPGPGPAQVSAAWREWWEEAAELWRLGLQAFAGCVRAQPWVAAVARESGWLGDTLALLASCSALPDPHSQGVLEEALAALAQHCSLCQQEIRASMAENDKGVLHSMVQLQEALAE